MRRPFLWGPLLLLVVLLTPSAAQATTSCTPQLTSPIVRFETTLGNIDVKLDSVNAPCTVNNFLSYVDSGQYNGSFFHRSATSPDVIQGGGWTLSSADQPVQICTPPSTPPSPNQCATVANEYNDPNIADSLAMALPSSDITGEACNSGLYDTATDEWFFNVADNSSGLDSECFTVFGQAIDPSSIAVINKIAAAQVCDLETQWSASDPNGSAFDLPGVPTIGYPAGACASSGSTAGTPPTPATAANLIFVNKIVVFTDTTAPVITIKSPTPHETFNLGQKVTASYSCNDGTGTGVDSCTGPSTVDTSLYGTLQYTVTTTDYADNEGTKSVTYIVELPPTLSSLGKVGSTGVVWAKVHCPSSVTCTGGATLEGGKPSAELAFSRYSIRSGATGKVRLALSASAFHAFKADHGRMSATLLITPSGTGSKSTTSKVKLSKAPAAKKKKSKPKKKKKKK